MTVSVPGMYISSWASSMPGGRLLSAEKYEGFISSGPAPPRPLTKMPEGYTMMLPLSKAISAFDPSRDNGTSNSAMTMLVAVSRI